MTEIQESSFYKGFVEVLQVTACVTTAYVGGTIFLVAHPIIGLIGSTAGLCSAAYHGILLNYHWKHSREKDNHGNLIPNTELNQLDVNNEKNYMNRNAKYSPSDITRLQNEIKRLYHVQAAKESLKWARGLAKCIIPIVGPIWAIFSEIKLGGSSPISSCGCADKWHHITPEKMLEEHIKVLNVSVKNFNSNKF